MFEQQREWLLDVSRRQDAPIRDRLLWQARCHCYM
jgi:hypothetical protein